MTLPAGEPMGNQAGPQTPSRAEAGPSSRTWCRGGLILTVAAPFLLLGCSGNGGDGPAGGGTPAPAGTAVPALDDAADRVLAGLPAACSPSVASALTRLQTRMSPQRTATEADVTAVRTALATCNDDATAPEVEAIGLSLDVASDIIAGR